MRCYFLQGVAGIIALALIVGVLVLLCVGVAWLDDRWKPSLVGDGGEMFGRVSAVAILSFLMGYAVWAVGGEVLKTWFHWCTT